MFLQGPSPLPYSPFSAVASTDSCSVTVRLPNSQKYYFLFPCVDKLNRKEHFVKHCSSNRSFRYQSISAWAADLIPCYTCSQSLPNFQWKHNKNTKKEDKLSMFLLFPLLLFR